MSKEDEARALLESEIIKAHIAELEKQLSEIESKKAELEYLKEGLTKLKGQKGKEMLLPFGSGVLIRGKVMDDEKVLVNIGSNVLVEKTRDEAKKIIDSQIKELEDVKKLIEKEIQKYSIF